MMVQEGISVGWIDAKTALCNSGQNNRNIIFSTGSFGQLDKFVGFSMDFNIWMQDFLDLIILDHVGEAVWTEEK